MDPVVTSLTSIIKNTKCSAKERKKFFNRLSQGNLTREKNPQSHFCVYFAVYDPQYRNVFIGHHKKSGLWLFNGGHMEKGELPQEAVIRETKEELGLRVEKETIPLPGLLTLTKIEHPERIICEWHYDIWYFLPFSKTAFHPDEKLLASEFFTWGWKNYHEAHQLMRDPNSISALILLSQEA